MCCHAMGCGTMGVVYMCCYGGLYVVPWGLHVVPWGGALGMWCHGVYMWYHGVYMWYHGVMPCAAWVLCGTHGVNCIPCMGGGTMWCHAWGLHVRSWSVCRLPL